MVVLCLFTLIKKKSKFIFPSYFCSNFIVFYKSIGGNRLEMTKMNLSFTAESYRSTALDYLLDVSVLP